MEKVQKTNYGKWRALTLSAVYLLMGLHIAHWKIAGRTLAPLEFNEVLYTIHLGIITAGFIFMGVALLATVIVGRFFCSWMCHILALQDASAWLLEKFNIKPKHFRSRILLWIPFLALIYLFVLPQIERLYLGQPPVAFKILTDGEGWASFVTNDFWRNLPSVGITLLTFFICGFLIVYFLGSRSFCQYGCPYGALFSLTDRITPGKIILSGDCNQCGICTATCQSHILIHKEVKEFGKVVDTNCLKDLDCVQVCPNDALKFGFTKPSLLQSLYSGGKNKKKYDFSYTEEFILASTYIVFVFIFRGLYDTIPFLLALSVSILLSYFVVVFYRLLRLEFVRMGSLILKKSDGITGPGKMFFFLFFIAMLLTIHSGWMHYHQYSGNIAYNRVAWNVKDEASAKIQQLEITDALNHLQLVDKYGIYHAASLSRELAAIYILKDDKENAKIQLEELLAKQPDDIEAQLRYAKILFTTNNEKDATESLKKIVDSETLTDHDQKIKSDALLMLGHIEEKNGFASLALDRYQQALKMNDQNAEAILALGVIYTKTNQLKDAESYLTRAYALYPSSPLIENNLAVVYVRMHKYALAQLHLENLLLLQPENYQAQYQLAMMVYGQGKKEESKIMLENILLKHPDYVQAQKALNMVNSSPQNGKIGKNFTANNLSSSRAKK